ncbi:uncharacterized protein LOC124479451 [Hypomesus transpacificus]|uniref:uncharacterized protein LOC124479451 n=1 Tax=Hypomesus transpacificus TaxID=137520 RepID=UPI001F07F457|nr:uncharacterized protein LOC124479451 [Hypomesus transpacificus]
MISHSQRGRMDEQRCSIDPSRSSPSTPKKTSTVPSGPEGDQFFRLLANTQGRRLDDQRVTLPSLPGIQKASSTSTAGQDSNYLCYMVSKVQSSRMEEQRCSLPHIHLSQGSPAAQRKNCLEPGSSSRGPPRSASFSPGSEIERPQIKDKHTQAPNVPPAAEQDKFFSMISHSQRGRMDEQRCSIDPSRSSPSTPRHSGSTVPSGPKGDQFFRLLANTQGRRLDDQRATLPAAPHIQNGGSTSKSGQDSNNLCYMVSKFQGSRMDEQRCSAPHILQSLGTPSAQKKSHSRPDTQALDTGLGPLSHAPQRSASFNPIPKKERPHSNTSHHQQTEQDKFFSMISHSQRDHMDEQRCSIDPSRSSPSTPKNTSRIPTGPDSEKFFKLLAKTQGRRLDDQRVSLPSLPGIQGTSRSANTKDSCVAPQNIRTEGSPVTLRKVQSRPVPHCQTFTKPVSPRGPPRSASFSPASNYMNSQNPPAQVTLTLSMSFTPQQVFL